MNSSSIEKNCRLQIHRQEEGKGIPEFRLGKKEKKATTLQWHWEVCQLVGGGGWGGTASVPLLRPWLEGASIPSGGHRLTPSLSSAWVIRCLLLNPRTIPGTGLDFLDVIQLKLSVPFLSWLCWQSPAAFILTLEQAVWPQMWMKTVVGYVQWREVLNKGWGKRYPAFQQSLSL